MSADELYFLRQVGETFKLHRAAIDTDMPPRLTNKQHIHRLSLYKSGQSDQEIANATRVTSSAIRYWRERNGLPSNCWDKSPVGKLEPTTVGYTAAFLDADGHISLTKYTRKDRARPIAYQSSLQFFNNNCNALLSIQEMLGVGNMIKSSHHGFTLKIGRMIDIKNILEQILPHLKIKQAEARILLDFINARLTHPLHSYTSMENDLYRKFREAAEDRKRLR